MSGPLLGWLVLMLQLDGVEMIYGGDSPPGRFNEGVLAQRVPWKLSADGWAQGEPPAQLDAMASGRHASRLPAFVREDRDHTSSERASYDDGTVA